MLAGHTPAVVLIILLALAGLGLGTAFSAILARLTTAATPTYAPDISGVFTTSPQVAGAIAVAGFGTAYLALIHHPGPAAATHAFAITTAAFALAALIAAALAYQATHLTASEHEPPDDSQPTPIQA